MATAIVLHRRLTGRYAHGFSHLDRWARAGTAKVLPWRRVEEGNGHDDIGTYLVHAVVKPAAGATRQDAARALRDSLDGTSCQHEFDCCGCRIQRARVLHVRGRKVVLRVAVSRNY